MASEIGFKAGTIDIPREGRETSLRKEESREAKKKGKAEKGKYSRHKRASNMTRVIFPSRGWRGLASSYPKFDKF